MQRKQNPYWFLWLILPLLLISAVSVQTRNIRVGFYDNAPLSFVDENGLPAGFVVDVLQYVAEKENWGLEYVHCEWNDCLQALEEGEIDLLAPIAYSDERAEIYDFTAETLITNWGQVYVHSGETDISIIDLEGKIVAVIEEDTHTKFLQKRLLNFGFTVEFIFVDSYDEVMQAVDSGQAFGGIVNHLYALQNAADYDVVQSAIVFNPIEVRFAATKGEYIEFLSALDVQLAALKADQNSLYYQQLNTWFGSLGGEVMPLWARWLAAFLVFMIVTLVLAGVFLRVQVRKRTADLQETEAKYRELVNNSLVGIQINQNKVLQFCNQGLADLYGYESPEEMIGMEIEALVTPESWLKVKGEIDAREAGQKQVSRYQAEGVRRDGEIIDIEVLGVGIQYKGKPAVQGMVIDITKRVQASEKLELYKTIIEEAHDSIAIIDPDGHYLEQNRAHAEMLGYSDNELHGKTPAIHFGEDVFAEIAVGLAKDGVFNREVQSTTKSGDKLHLDLSSFGIKDSLGQLICYVGIKRNITEQTQAEKNLQDSEKRYRSLFENNHAVMLLIDPFSGEIVDANPAASKYYGWTVAELKSMRIDQINELSREEVAQEMQNARLTERNNFLFKHRLADDSVRDVEVYSGKIDLDGQEFLYSIIHDVTARMEVEEALQESNLALLKSMEEAEENKEKFQVITNQATEGITVADMEGNYVFVNPAFCEMSGYSSEELLKMTVFDMKAKDQDHVTFYDSKDEKEGIPILVKLQRKDETEYITEVIGTVISLNNQELVLGTVRDVTEQERAAEALRRSNELLEQERKMFIGGAVATFKWQNKEGWPVEYVSPNIHTILGYTAEQFMSGEVSYADIILSEDIERVASEVTEGEESGVERFVHEPYRIVKKGGEIIWVADYTTILRDKSGETTHYLGYTLDITERINSEDALRKSEKKYRDIFENAMEGIFQTTIDGRFLSVNPAAARMYGYETPEELIAEVTDIRKQIYVDGHDRDGFVKGLNENQDVITTLDRNYRKDGSIIWVAANAHLIRDKKGNALYVEGFFEDVTERVNAEKSLRESEAFLRQSQEVARLGSYDMDITKGIWNSSPVLNMLFGIDDEYPFDTEGWVKIIHPDDREMLQNYFAEDVVSQHKRFDKEYRIIRIDDKENRWVHSLGELELDNQGNPSRIIGTVQDITERVQAEEALQKHTKQLETLNTITSALSGSLDLEDLLETILEEVARVIQFDSSSIFLLEDDNSQVTIAKAVGEAAKFTGRSIPHDETLMRGMGTDRQALILDDANQSPNYREWGNQNPIRGWMGLPLFARDTLLGYLTLDSSLPRAFTVEHAALAESFTPQIAQALYNARLYEATQRQSKDLAALLRASQALATTLDRDEVLQTAVEEITNTAGVESGAIYLLEEEILYLGATSPPLPPEFPKKLRYAPLVDHPTIQKAIDENASIFLPDTSKAELSPAEKAVCEIRGLSSIFYLPFKSREQVAGVLILGTVGNIWMLSESEMDLYQTLTTQVGMAVENAHLYGQVIRDANEMEARVRDRTEELQRFVNLTAGREIRMAELKKVVRELRTQIENAGMMPVADDPLEKP